MLSNSSHSSVHNSLNFIEESNVGLDIRVICSSFRRSLVGSLNCYLEANKGPSFMIAINSEQLLDFPRLYMLQCQQVVIKTSHDPL